MAETTKINIRGVNEPIEKSPTGYTWGSELDITLNVPPAVLIAIVEDLFTAPEAKEMVHDGLVQFMSKKFTLAKSIERQHKANANTTGAKTAAKK